MKSTLKADLERLEKLAYHRKEWCGPLVERYYAIREKEAGQPDFLLLEKVYPWLLVPLTLWAVNFHALIDALIAQMEAGKRTNRKMRLLIETLPPLPTQKVQSVVAKHELDVQKGDYAIQVKATAKFDLREEALMEDAAFQNEWLAIKQDFDVATFEDRKGVIRRSLVSERGFRPSWEDKHSESEFLFRAVFDLFCQKWELYGMQRDRPLLQRLTVNLTPNGTMIFIPSWWSLDGKRDLNWKELHTLHAARVTSKQGEKLTRNQVALRKDALRVSSLYEQATKDGLRGEKRVNWIARQMKWVGDSSIKLARYRKRAKY